MKAPPIRKGNFGDLGCSVEGNGASMKAPPKRKGKSSSPRLQTAASPCLNESPSKKEGKCGFPETLRGHLGRLNESLHFKLQNKRFSSYPGPSQQSVFLKIPTTK